jgi:hypothetical protein
MFRAGEFRRPVFTARVKPPAEAEKQALPPETTLVLV